jgi:hypothetical protein
MKRVLAILILIAAMVAISACMAAASGSSVPAVDPWTKAYLALSTIVAVAGILKAFKIVPAWAVKAIDTAAAFDPSKILMLKNSLATVDARTATVKQVVRSVSEREKWGLTAETVDNLVDVLAPQAARLKIRRR